MPEGVQNQAPELVDVLVDLGEAGVDRCETGVDRCEAGVDRCEARIDVRPQIIQPPADLIELPVAEEDAGDNGGQDRRHDRNRLGPRHALTLPARMTYVK